MLSHYSTLLARLWNWVKEQQTTEELNNIDRQTAWHLVAAKRKLEALGKLWKCVNEELSPQEPYNKFLVTKDDNKRSVLDMAEKLVMYVC